MTVLGLHGGVFKNTEQDELCLFLVGFSLSCPPACFPVCACGLTWTHEKCGSLKENVQERFGQGSSSISQLWLVFKTIGIENMIV